MFVFRSRLSFILSYASRRDIGTAIGFSDVAPRRARNFTNVAARRGAGGYAGANLAEPRGRRSMPPMPDQRDVAIMRFPCHQARDSCSVSTRGMTKSKNLCTSFKDAGPSGNPEDSAGLKSN